MRKNRAKKTIKVFTDEEALERNSHFYPLLHGWSDNYFQPIFKTPSAALCYQISRYLRDSHCYDTVNLPKWLRCVGGINVLSTDLEKFTFKSGSKKERYYFQKTPIYCFKPSVLARTTRDYIRTDIFQVSNALFEECRYSCKEHPDYMLSSNSIFRSSCLNRPVEITDLTYLRHRNGIPQTRDPSTGLISVGYNTKCHFKNGKTKFESFKAVAEQLQRVQLKTDAFIVVSLGCGVPITELNSSCLCLCIDKDMRALSTGVMIAKSRYKRSSRCVLAYMDFGKKLQELLRVVSKITGLKLKILFQHPSPSSDCFQKLKIACSNILTCLDEEIVESLCFVYDKSEREKSNSWNKESLLDVCIPDSLKYFISKEVVISEKGSVDVVHPIFGDTNRFGWAEMKNSTEWSFIIRNFLKIKINL